MILVLAIILFIIYLIYSIKPRREEYTLEGLELSWKNKASIEGIVTKWIVTLKDSSGNVIHTYENNESKNLKDFTDVSMNIVDKKEFDEKIIGDNKLELYYNEVNSENKLYTKTVTFTEDDFGMTLDTTNLEEIVPNIDCVGKYIKVKKDKNTEGAERFACGPEADSDRHYCQFWKHKIEMEKKGTGKACSRANNHVIKTQWPTETTASKRIGTSFQNDPNPNTDENVLNNPQHYKNIWDRAPSRITEIPHQIDSGSDGWCWGDGITVHQDIPGCGRICSSATYVGRKDKNSWGSWGDNQNDIDCPAAKLDQVWKKEGNSRKLAVGNYSGAAPPPPPASASASTSTSGIKYVWFGYENSDWPERPLNIAEIEVYSGGVNIVKDFTDGKVESSSQYNASWATPKSLFDGNKESGMAHTEDSKTNWWKINLGKEYSAIDKVMVYNRGDCCYDRWAESFVKLLDKDGNEIARSEKLPSNKDAAKNYKEGDVRVKTFTFGSPTPITEIPHQIPRAAPGGWCNHGNSVHQDVPGCGRICSDSNTVGRKDKGTWGSWDAYPGSVNCPAAKLDQVWKMEGGSRKLAIGNYSAAMDLTGGFKWYYYEGSYFSVPSSFNNATPTKTGTGIKNFSNKHNATGGYLPNHGNKSNYAVRWQGRFVPKKTGTHKFWTESDDMSYLYVRNSKVVDNGGLHGMVKKEGTINMTKGKEYLIEIFFGEKGGGDEIKVWFQGPDMSLAKHDFSGYMVNDTKLCSSGMFGGRSNNGITDYKHCMECAHKWEPGQHKRAINCENIWLDD